MRRMGTLNKHLSNSGWASGRGNFFSWQSGMNRTMLNVVGYAEHPDRHISTGKAKALHRFIGRLLKGYERRTDKLDRQKYCNLIGFSVRELEGFSAIFAERMPRVAELNTRESLERRCLETSRERQRETRAKDRALGHRDALSGPRARQALP
jgi:hypothetical protein